MNNRLSYVDALRGYAILAVILCHTVGFAAGAMGVQLFYIMSAFTLFLSIKKRDDEKGDYLYFLIRRFFRIAPLFYLAIIFYFFNDRFMPRPQFWSGGNPITIFTLIPKIFFINGWNPYWINSVVPGGWSIAVEMPFYLLIPILYKKIKDIKQALWLTLLSLLGSITINYILFRIQPIEQTDLWGYYLYYWLPNQMPIFALGIVLFFLVTNYENKKNSLLLCIVSLFSLAAITNQTINFLVPAYKKVIFLPTHFLYGICFIMFAYALSLKHYKIFVNKFIVFLGKVSYSAYLSHFVVINISQSILTRYGITGTSRNILIFIMVVVLTMILSYILYISIEKPGIKLGSRLIEYLKNRKILNRNNISIS